jgi:hypothetical protein
MLTHGKLTEDDVGKREKLKMERMERLVEDKFTRAAALLKKAAAQGHHQARAALGV